MKEIIVSENNKLEIRETEIPEYGENEVLVKVAYSGLCGSDIPRIFHHGAHYYPVRLGHEFTGHVISTGSGVTSVKEGDKVCCVPLIPNFDAEESKRGYYSLVVAIPLLVLVSPEVMLNISQCRKAVVFSCRKISLKLKEHSSSPSLWVSTLS